MHRYSHEGVGDYTYTGRGRGRPYPVSVLLLVFIGLLYYRVQVEGVRA